MTIEIQSVQNEEMDGKLQTALNSGDAPDIFMSRGGGKLADVVEAGQAMDITEGITEATKTALGDAVLSAFAIDGKNYGMPTAVLPSGIFYASELLDAAGVTAPPATIDELVAADDAIKATGVAPIAVGAKDAWPAAHWYYNFALRACSKDVMDEAAESRSFDDPCWLDRRREPRGVHRDRAVQRRVPHDGRPAGRRLVRRPAGEPPGGHGAHGRVEPRRHRLAHAR